MTKFSLAVRRRRRSEPPDGIPSKGYEEAGRAALDDNRMEIGGGGHGLPREGEGWLLERGAVT